MTNMKKKCERKNSFIRSYEKKELCRLTLRNSGLWKICRLSSEDSLTTLISVKGKKISEKSVSFMADRRTDEPTSGLTDDIAQYLDAASKP